MTYINFKQKKLKTFYIYVAGPQEGYVLTFFNILLWCSFESHGILFGVPWYFLEPHGALLESHGTLWSLMILFRKFENIFLPWHSLDPHGILFRIPWYPFGDPWYSFEILKIYSYCGTPWSPMVLLQSPMVPVWRPMLLFGFPRYSLLELGTLWRPIDLSGVSWNICESHGTL